MPRTLLEPLAATTMIFSMRNTERKAHIHAPRNRRDDSSSRIHRQGCLFALLCLLVTPLRSMAYADDAPAPLGGEYFFLRANLEFTLFHELSHMLIDELELPVLGMEEDAADRIAVVAMLLARQEQPPAKVIPWLFAVAGDWYTEWEWSDEANAPHYADPHPLEIQRFHNVVCLVFGSNPDLLDGLIDTTLLPFERAMTCEREYRLAQRAVQWVSDSYGHQDAHDKAGAAAGKILVSYMAANPDNRPVYDWLRRSRLANDIAEFVATRIALPHDIRIEFDNCPRDPDALWRADLRRVGICYELLQHFLTVGRYRIANHQRACAIPALRRFVGDVLLCDAAVDVD